MKETRVATVKTALDNGFCRFSVGVYCGGGAFVGALGRRLFWIEPVASLFRLDFGLCDWSPNSDHASSLRKGDTKRKMNSKPQVIRNSFWISVVLFLGGLLVASLLWSKKEALWFGVGGGIGLLNFMLGALFVRQGLKSLRRSGIFLFFLLIKSFAFVGVVAIVLMISRPALLPFTLGISLVIFGPLVWALWESRKYLKVVSKDQHGV